MVFMRQDVFFLILFKHCSLIEIEIFQIWLKGNTSMGFLGVK